MSISIANPKNKPLDMKKEVEIIVIEWERVEFKSNQGLNKQTDIGLYQVYGNHNSYGPNSLLYIGQAQSTFDQRLLNDSRLWGDFLESTIEPEYIRVGRIVKSNSELGVKTEEEDHLNDYINIAEHILIATHTPALNSQLDYRLGRLTDKYKDRNVLIVNLGDRGKILPEVSTIRNSYLLYEYETPFRSNSTSDIQTYQTKA